MRFGHKAVVLAAVQGLDSALLVGRRGRQRRPNSRLPQEHGALIPSLRRSYDVALPIARPTAGGDAQKLQSRQPCSNNKCSRG